ncbi:MAG: hypothetical protein KDC07_09330 [Chitinophagaceae bacterium]|nr:hypothetical protein [Chitinophagaceae bacterium]MCB9046459.1 hypothetical protein [Chitinophagales bacterium]
MRKFRIISLASLLLITAACNKQTNTHNPTLNTANTARTVGPISFTGLVSWLKFGTRENITGTWECTNSYDFCEYQYVAPPVEYNVTAGEAIGEIGYESGILHIALDKNSMTESDKSIIYTRDGEFHWSCQGYFTTSGFDIKNIDDEDQSSIGDIHVDAGTYSVYEDETSILIVFEEIE